MNSSIAPIIERTLAAPRCTAVPPIERLLSCSADDWHMLSQRIRLQVCETAKACKARGLLQAPDGARTVDGYNDSEIAFDSSELPGVGRVDGACMQQ
jgi:hypothetical protein